MNRYNTKAKSDREELRSYCSYTVPDAMLDAFCKHAAHLQLLRYEAIAGESHTAALKINQQLDTVDAMGMNIYWYIVARGAHAFAQREKRKPSKVFFYTAEK